MDVTIAIMHRLGDACLQLLAQPYYYIGIAFVILLYRRKIKLERKLFLTKLHSFLGQTWETLLWGIAAGFIVSCIMLLVGVTIQQDTLVLLWVITLLFMLFRARFFCFAYAVGAIGILHVIASEFNWRAEMTMIDHVLLWLQHIHLPTLLAIVAVAHFMEALLIRWSSAQTASPMIVRGKRGRLIGGYRIEGFWVLPLFLVIPSVPSQHLIDRSSERLDSFVNSSQQQLPAFVADYFPLLAEIISSQGHWAMLAFPFAIGFSVWTTSMHAKDKARWTSSLLSIYSLVILGLAFVVAYWPWPSLMIIASLLCIVIHEGIVWYSAWQEQERSPIFTHDQQGLLILGVIANSPAEALGIVPGEIVRQVNGVMVQTREELHEAFKKNPAFCNLEVVNLEGHSKFLRRPIFADEHHQLGLIFAPDEATLRLTKRKSPSVISYITMR